jgi:FKBP-type peptidyl-prolyl cis-trans isomerase 2
MSIKTGDFIEIDFVGRIKITNQIFDVTLADAAKKEGIFDEKQKYKPVIACVGKGQLLKGLDSAVQSKKAGDEFEIELQPKDAFGERDQKLLQLASINKFKEFRPVPGLQVSVDGTTAIVKSVTGGRVILDFNHPLAGKVLKYWVKINRIVEKTDEKIKGLLSITLGVDAEVKETEKEITVKLGQKLEDGAKDLLKKSIEEIIPEIKQKELKFE